MTVLIPLKRNDWIFHTGHDFGHLCRVDESECVDIPIMEFSIILEHLPFLHGCKQILRQLLVPRTLAVWI